MMKNFIIYTPHIGAEVAQSAVSDYRLDEQGSIAGRGKGFFL
jgi:hypothetical protein